MRGRKPKPTALHELHGNPGELRKGSRAGEPIAVGELSDPPPYLNASQREGWYYTLRHAPAGLLKLIDRGTLAAWIVAEDIFSQATIEQNKTTLMLRKPGKGDAPAEIPSPYLMEIRHYMLVMVKLASELGFTPASRPRIFVASMPGEAFAVRPANSGAPFTRKRPAKDKPALTAFLASDPDATSIH